MIHLLLYTEQPLVRHAICALLDVDKEIAVTTTDCIKAFANHLADAEYQAILFATNSGGGKFCRTYFDYA